MISFLVVCKSYPSLLGEQIYAYPVKELCHEIYQNLNGESTAKKLSEK